MFSYLAQADIYLRLNALQRNANVYSSSPDAFLMSLDTSLAIGVNPGRSKSTVLTSPAAALAVTKSMHHTSFREVNSLPVTQETVHFLWITNAHYHFRTSPLPLPVVSQMNSVHNTIFCQIHFSLPKRGSSEKSLPFRFSH